MKDKEKNRESINIKLIILILLLIILVTCSFKTGEKFYILKHTFFDTTMSESNSEIARWYFSAVIRNK